MWCVVTSTLTNRKKATTMPDFLLYALLAGLALALVSGPLGSFVVWRRMAYFGDTLAHSALLGVALGVLFAIPGPVAVIVGCGLIALLLIVLEQQRILALDTLLGILAHSALALGLVVMSLLPSARVNLEALLFGDLLSTTPADLALIYALTGVILVAVIWAWRPLLAMTVNPELAQAEGINVMRYRSGLVLLTALLIAISLKVVGVLLITAMLIIPAATARRFARSPEQMAILASLLCAVAIVAGLAVSWFADTPAGPSAVVASGVMFALSLHKRQPQ